MYSIESASSLLAVELARAGAAVGILSIPGFRQVPATTRSFLALILASCCFFAKLGNPAAVIPDESEFWWLFFRNTFSGVFAALVWNAVLDASALAVQIASLQSGLSYASIIDPSNETETGSMLALTQFSILIVLLGAGVHLEFLGLLLDSDAVWNRALAGGAGMHLFLKELLRHSFLYGVRLGIPFVAILLLLDIASALASRFAERFQLSGMLFPVKWVITLLILLLSMPAIHHLEVSMARHFLPVGGAR